MKKLYLLFPVLIMVIPILSGQVYSDKIVGKKNAELADSLKSVEYPYLLPIWGQKVIERGFDIPYPLGLSVNYLWQESELVINNLNISFNNGPAYNLDEIIRFNEAISTTSGVNIRPDFWLLPFLNVYGIFAKSQSSTYVDFGVWLPNDDTWEEIFSTQTQAEFEGTTAGFGLTPTLGVGGGWIAFDMNFSWTDIEALERPAFAFVFGPRFGKTFRFKQPERNIALWVGGFRVKLNSGTEGSLPISDLISLDELEMKIETGYQKVGEKQQQVDEWWAGLSPAEMANPINKAKYESANSALAKAGALLEAASTTVDNIETSTVQYSLDKKQKNAWNFLIGSQFQLNKHWMVRAEVGILGTRQQFIGGLQYRFGL